MECDEVYIVAGHKGHPAAVRRQGRLGRRRRLKSQRGRGTLEREKPPVLGMIQRGGEVVLHMLSNVQQRTIQPIIRQTVRRGSLIYTDEYAIYERLQAWSLLRSWLRPHRGISQEHLPFYLAFFEFAHNVRRRGKELLPSLLSLLLAP